MGLESNTKTNFLTSNYHVESSFGMLIVALLTFVSIVLCFPVVELSDMYLPEGVMPMWNYAFEK